MKVPDTLQDWVRSLEKFGDRPCIFSFTREDSEELSFAHLVTRVHELSAGLRSHGLSKGDSAVLCAPGSVAWIIVCFAILDAGAVPVPVDSQMTSENLSYVFKDTSAEWLFTNEQGEQRLRESGLCEGRRVVRLDETQSESGWQSYLSKETSANGAAHSARDDTAVIFYTSGTTGPPKGVPLTHRNLLSNLESLLELKLVTENDRLFLPLPLHHVYPFTIGLLAPLSEGASIVLPLSLMGSQIMRALRAARVTGIISVPRFYAALYDGIETQLQKQSRFALLLFRLLLGCSRFLCRRCGWCAGRRLFRPLHQKIAPELRLISSGGAALDPELAWTLEGLGWRVASGYGLTETSPILTFNLPGEGIGTAGQPLPGVDIRIAEAEPGREHGEVQAKGANVFSGYLYRDEETKEAFTEDGYFRTGDLGYFDDGRLRLTGRASTMIVLSGGENLQPDTIEEALGRAPHIREAAVLQKGEALAALIVPKPNGSEDQDSLRERIAREVREGSAVLPSHHRISDFALTREPLPRTRLGKLQRHELERLFDEAKQGEAGGREAIRGPIPVERMSPEDRQLLEEPAARAVWEWLAERFPDARLAPDTHLGSELGIDSMEWLNLSLQVQKVAGVDLSEEAIGRIESVHDLLREAAEAQRGGDKGELYERLQEPSNLLDEEQKRWLEPPGPVARALGEFLLAGNRRVMRSFFQLSVEGVENLPDAPYVLAPNHRSYLDAPAIAAALPAAEVDRTYWGGWTGIMLKNRFMRALSRGTRVVPIDVERRVLSSLAFAVCVLQKGFNLVWFPEGAISEDGELKAFQPGIGLVLATKRVPVVPVRIRGSREALPRERWIPRRRPISVTFGEPIESSDFLAERSESGQEKLVDLLHERVAAL